MSLSELTSTQKSDIIDTLVGYTNGLERVVVEYDLEIEEIEELALDHNVERCEACDWFVFSHDINLDQNVCNECAIGGEDD